MPAILDHLPTVQQVIFILIGLFTAVSALLVVVAPNLFHNALALVATFFGVTGLYVLLEAEFLAVSQVLIYVGAISTLITFAIMLTRGMMYGRTSPTNQQRLAAAIMAVLFFLVLAGLLVHVPWPVVGAELKAGEAIIADLGELFVTTYLIPFELMALLLLVALAGALMLARDR
ncbi:NADH-quinone oxidoreductase subunit J [Litorilinea aerophila]|uniref:NADH-quinone oxidoreductase subunit J n=1 Tax=Litorilinea aerophila TaxID=1204385 RepID=A0A540VAN8_9CHLR|nr:NADH-quinone oxidoreductase subunit J [Litorilinea aerophila]MCC9078327.1 NADH-quinone oxidoreductase subunit J [Litorilinea aerophila]GIV77129.1 MAG: NADH-quinone oxidoreductase subunit J [Litorilinea sp.]